MKYVRLRIPLLYFCIFALFLCHSASPYRPTYKSTVACPSNSLSPKSIPQPTQSKVTLSVTGWASSKAEDKLVKQLIQRFQQLHPNIHLVWDPISGDYSTHLQHSFDNNQAPDVFYLQPSMAATLIPDGHLLNLSPFMENDNIEKDKYHPILVSPFTCENGTIYGLPKDWNTLGIYYNKDLFRKAGLPFPDSKWTWNDLRTTAKYLTRLDTDPNKSIYGITLPALSSRWLAFLLANGGSVLNQNGTQAAFHQYVGIEALKFYASMQQEDGSSAIPTDITSSGDQSAFDAFVQQRVAMVIEGGWLRPHIAQNNPSLSYGIAPLPLSPSGQKGNLIFTNAWAAASQTPHPAEAWAFIRFMTDQEAQSIILRSGLAFPSLIQLKDNHAPPEIQMLSEVINYGQIDYFGPHDSSIHEYLDSALDNVLLQGKDPSDALYQAAQMTNLKLQGNDQSERGQ